MAQGMVSVLPNHPGDFRAYNYTNVAAQTASVITVLKQGGGVLHGYSITATGAAATSQLQLIDSTASGQNILFTFPGTQVATQVVGLDLAFTTALSVQAVLTTSTTGTMTVLWK